MSSKKTKFGYYAIQTLLYMQVVLSILLAPISEVFPDAPVLMVQLVFNIALFSYFVAAFIASMLTRVMTKKNILMTGTVLLLVGGIVPLFLQSSIIYFVVSGALIGMGCGMLEPISVAYIHEKFAGEQAEHILGIGYAMSGLGGMVFIQLAAILADINWTYGYYVMLAAVPVLLIIAVCLPNDGKIERKTEKGEKATPFTKPMVLMLIVFAGYAIFQGTLLNNISFLVEEEGVGSIALAGSAAMLYSGGGIIAGFIEEYILKIFKKTVYGVVCLINLAGMILPLLSLSSASIVIASILCGFGCALFNVVCLIYVPEKVGHNELAIAPGTTAVTIVFNLATFVSAAIVNGLTVLFLPDKAISRFIISAIGLVIMAVIGFAVQLWFEKDTKKENGQTS